MSDGPATTYTVPLYQAIAQKLQAAAVCDARAAVDGNSRPGSHWCDRAAEYRDAAAALVREHMPRGAGIDDGVTLSPDSDERRLIFDLSYHYMDGSGGYCGWVEYTATVEPSLTSAFDLGLIEDDEALATIRAEYAAEATSEEDEDEALDFAPESAADYIFDVLHSALVAQVDPYARATRELAAVVAAAETTPAPSLTPRQVFYFERRDESDAQPSGWYVRPGLDCIDGDGPFSAQSLADVYAAEAETYLRDVFGCTLRYLQSADGRTTLDCIRENADEGFPLDRAILEALSDITAGA